MLKQKIQVLFLSCLILVCTICTVHAEAAARQLPLDQAKLQAVGKQDSKGEACSCYALAYCRTILDGTVHSFSEYNQNGNTEFNVLCVWSRGDYTPVTAASGQQVLKACYDSINQGRPVIIHVQTKYSQHWVTVVGYENVNDPEKMTADNLLIIDPLYGYEGKAQANPYGLYDNRYVKTDKGSAAAADTPAPAPTAAPPAEGYSFRTGDADLNGSVNAADALTVLRHAAQLSRLSARAYEKADVNGDGAADAMDALEILRHSAKLTDTFQKDLSAIGIRSGALLFGQK